ncbi:ABC transporter ATP-binding protein [Actinobacteria bacterium YIM 96077]|uniref:ABC transporter ATP-binding protein n=1 Tax=Phytoactinopolyspora halophila TaxID=1981511 RepID=A0A329R0C1_9ACTN|nr:ABC transporter ATP-binding protein [Phytoactinopolyspora halophila]AYY13153.1 ABC transporter ATP-binding protein [Actinobacteria bacterium YIM 96077]RAW17606.1 ABC transporter ATP-binding protein [Phytoactinopolyspora halophila]
MSDTAPESDTIVSVQGLHVSYGRVQAVRDISFDVPAGAVVTLVGANGAGKTTVLNAVAGLVKPRAGTVLYRGRDVTRWPAHKLVAAGMVLVPEGRQILGTLTVAENLQLGGWRRRKASAAAIDEMYERFPVLAERRNLRAGSLSGGEQQMLAIARAMVARPQVILMDEPSMGLAPKMVDEIFGVIETVRSSGVTVVLVEQNARRALRAADTGYVLETGTLAHSGPAARLLKDPRVVQAYLGVE